MKTIRKQSRQFTIPRYEENAALQLVAFTGVTFIMFHFARVLLLVFGHNKVKVFEMTYPNIGLSTIEVFKHKFWTIFSYGLAHHGFWDWITNMIWAYSFASVMQSLAGYKQVVPLFFYGLFFGGIFYFVGQLVMPEFFILQEGQYILGAYGGISAIAIGALWLAPRQRLYFGEHFGVPVYMIAIVYFTLTTISYWEAYRGILLLSFGGVVTGALFTLLLKNGYQPATWIYTLLRSAEKTVTPKEDVARKKREQAKRKELLQTYYTPTDELSQEQIDELLDKINERGYYSLTREERELLKKAGK